MLACSTHVHSETWWRLETTGFVVYTDVKQSDAVALAQQLKALEQLAGEYLPTVQDSPSSKPASSRDLEVLVFAKRRDFVRLLKPRHFVSFARPDFDSTLLMVAPASSRRSLLANLRHEYAHYYLRKQKLFLPPWYDEGMASLLEHVDITLTGHSQLDSAALFERYDEPLRAPNSLSLAQLLGTQSFLDWPRQRVQRFYGLSGQLVHFLLYGEQRGYGDRRPGLQKYLLEGATDLPGSLGISRRQLEREFRRYRKTSNKPTHEVPFDSDFQPPAIRQLTPYEVLTVQARAAEGVNPEAALERYAAAAAVQPDAAESWLSLAQAHLSEGDAAAAQRALARAQQIAPASSGVKVQQAKLLMHDCWLPGSQSCRTDWREASELIHAALDQQPEQLEGIYLLGLVDLYRGRADLAVNYLWIAHRYAPWVPKVNYHLGECLRLLGDSRARIYLSNAQHWSQEDTWRRAAAASLALLQ